MEIHTSPPIAATSFSDLLQQTGLPLATIWPILTGAPANDKHVRDMISDALGVSRESLIWRSRRMRCHALELLAMELEVHKTTVFRILRSEMTPGKPLALRLAALTGIPVDEWMRPTEDNWMLVEARINLVEQPFPDSDYGK